MPSSAAFLSFDPAPGPATTRSVLARDRSGHARAERLGLRLGFVAAHRLEAAGEHDRLAAHPRFARFDDERRRRYLGEQIVPDLPVVRLVEEVAERLDHYRADAVDRARSRLDRLRRRRRAAPSAAARSAGRSTNIFIRSRAVIAPTWRMPSPNSNRAASGARFASIAASRASTDLACHPSRPTQFVAVRGEPEDVGGLADPAEIEKLDQRLLAQPVDVERAAR